MVKVQRGYHRTVTRKKEIAGESSRVRRLTGIISSGSIGSTTFFKLPHLREWNPEISYSGTMGFYFKVFTSPFSLW